MNRFAKYIAFAGLLVTIPCSSWADENYNESVENAPRTPSSLPCKPGHSTRRRSRFPTEATSSTTTTTPSTPTWSRWAGAHGSSSSLAAGPSRKIWHSRASAERCSPFRVPREPANQDLSAYLIGLDSRLMWSWDWFPWQHSDSVPGRRLSVHVLLPVGLFGSPILARWRGQLRRGSRPAPLAQSRYFRSATIMSIASPFPALPYSQDQSHLSRKQLASTSARPTSWPA